MKNILWGLVVCLCFASCSPSDNSNGKEIETLSKEVARLSGEVKSLNLVIASLRDSLELYRYPACDRYNAILQLIESGRLDDAEKEISHLQKVFPNSSEAERSKLQERNIAKRRAELKAANDRLKSLGYKAFPDTPKFTIHYNKVIISDIVISDEFYFDDYGDSRFYRTADRDNKYITAGMSITSEDKSPKLPIPAIYSLNDGVFNYISQFDLEFAKWEDYGTYLGNYHDNDNDFAKRSTVKFCIGKEIPAKTAGIPLLIVVKNENCAFRMEDRFSNPPVRYSGYCSYPKSLSVEDLNSPEYTVIRIINRNKL